MSTPLRGIARWTPQSGLTLVEMLIALLLGVLLSGGVIAAYLNGKRQYLYEDQMARMQENGRYALRLMSRELAMAGFFAGLPDSSIVDAAPVAGDCSPGVWALDTARPLSFIDNQAGPLAPRSSDGDTFSCVDPGTILPGTDLLGVKRSFARPSLYRGDVAPDLTRGGVETWYLRRLEGAPAQWEQHRPRDLDGPAFADPGLSLWEASARVFFIRPFAVEPADTVPTLCMETLAGDSMTARCLVEGVEDMQFEFGLDTTGNGVVNRYQDALGATEMDSAVSVSVHLLLRSLSAVPGHIDTRSYTLGSKHVNAPGDAYLRRVFSTSVPLRNLAAQRLWRDD